MTSSNEISWKLPPPEIKSWLRPCLKVPASFWIRLSCFSVQCYLCKTPADIYKACSNSKIHPSGPNYASLLIHISSKWNSANGGFLYVKNCFVTLMTSTRRERSRPLDSLDSLPLRGDVQTTRAYFHTVFWIVSSSRLDF